MRGPAFDRLYEIHARPLLGFLIVRTGDRALAEDLLSDTFERVLRSRRSPDPEQRATKTWLYTIALNLHRDHARRAATGSRAMARVAAAAEVPDHSADLEVRDAVSRALACLSEEERETVALRYRADLTLQEIARMTRVKQTTAEGRLYRAVRKLKRELE